MLSCRAALRRFSGPPQELVRTCPVLPAEGRRAIVMRNMWTCSRDESCWWSPRLGTSPGVPLAMGLQRGDHRVRGAPSEEAPDIGCPMRPDEPDPGSGMIHRSSLLGPTCRVDRS
jgi:hypothetical protein